VAAMGRSPDRLRVHNVVVQRLDPVCTAVTTIRRFVLLSVLVAASWVSIAFLDPTAAFSTTSPSPEPSSTEPSTTPLVDVSGNQALWFIGIVAGAVGLLWFSLLFFDLWSTNRWRRKGQRELFDKVIEGARKKGGGLSVEEVRQFMSAIDQPPRGASGLTRSLLALTIVTLVGVAMVATLVSTSADSVDQRKTIITSLLSITATISGFYFGARTAQTSNEQATKPPEAVATQGAPGPAGPQGPQGGAATSSEAASSDAALPSGDAGSSGTALPSVVLLPDEADDEDAEDDAEISDTEPEEAPDPAEHDGSDVELAESDELETMKGDAEGREGD
jgi:hypothetical protein